MVDKKNENVTSLAGRTEPVADFATDGIATKLRDFYLEIENEGIPDNLVHLLDRLDKAEKAQSANEARQED